MSVDLLIKNGLIVDGKGGPPVVGDVAIQGDRIVEVGRVAASEHDARKVIDATGCVVTPGFIDIHTHLDAQLFWDPAGTPSCMHGVTTIVLSACGFGIAPCAEGDGDNVLTRLQLLEEIPTSVTSIAVPMTWRSWADYRAALGELPLGVNVASYVPHSAIRSAVLGPRSKVASITAEELKAVIDEVEGALEAGALGLATSRLNMHKEPDGSPLASVMASEEELAALVQMHAGRPWQIAVKPESGGRTDAFVEELDRYADWTKAAGARLSWNPLVIMNESDAWRSLLARTHELQADGAEVMPQVIPVPVTTAFSFANNGSFRAARVPGWGDVLRGFPHGAPISERLSFMERPEVREGLKAAGTGEKSSAAPSSVNEILSPKFHRWRVQESPTHPEYAGKTLSEALGTGKDGVDRLFDLFLADGLATTIGIPLFNIDEDALTELCTAEGTIFGLGDSGAHLTSITSFNWPTAFLSKMVRDDKAISLEAGVARLTSGPAHYLGLKDRGELTPGYAADVCVIDLQALDVNPSEFRWDLPGGEGRIFQGATGYQAVIVNGTVSIQNDQLVGAESGRFVTNSA